MQLPPNLTRVQVNVPLGPANVLQFATIVAAPGATVRIRLWQWSGAYVNTVQIPNRAWWSMDDSVTSLGNQSTQGFAGAFFTYPGGLPIVANRPLRALLLSDLANVNTIIEAWYTLEAV